MQRLWDLEAGVRFFLNKYISEASQGLVGQPGCALFGNGEFPTKCAELAALYPVSFVHYITDQPSAEGVFTLLSFLLFFFSLLTEGFFYNLIKNGHYCLLINTVVKAVYTIIV